MKKTIIFLVLVFGFNVGLKAGFDKDGNYVFSKDFDKPDDSFDFDSELDKIINPSRKNHEDKQKCAKGKSESCFILGQKNEKHKFISAKYYKKSCDLGYSKGCLKIEKQQKKYWNCIVKKMPNVKVNRAVNFVNMACKNLSLY